ncbi:hypothetical protein ACLOJK_020700 [Asimina triloba]
MIDALFPLLSAMLPAFLLRRRLPLRPRLEPLSLFARQRCLPSFSSVDFLSAHDRSPFPSPLDNAAYLSSLVSASSLPHSLPLAPFPLMPLPLSSHAPLICPCLLHASAPLPCLPSSASAPSPSPLLPSLPSPPSFLSLSFLLLFPFADRLGMWILRKSTPKSRNIFIVSYPFLSSPFGRLSVYAPFDRLSSPLSYSKNPLS